jgi:hypothetical protein
VELNLEEKEEGLQRRDRQQIINCQGKTQIRVFFYDFNGEITEKKINKNFRIFCLEFFLPCDKDK